MCAFFTKLIAWETVRHGRSKSRARPSPRVSTVRWIAVVILLALGSPSLVARAQTGGRRAEARAHFDRGTLELEAAQKLRGQDRIKKLEEALSFYLLSLRALKNRNALLNAALVLDELARNVDAYRYYQDLSVLPGATEKQRTLARERMAELSKRIAFIRLDNVPPGAMIWVDRRDIQEVVAASSIVLPADPGSHRVGIIHANYEDYKTAVKLVAGKTHVVELRLIRKKITVTLAQEGDGVAFIDGRLVEPDLSHGRSVPLEIVGGVHRFELRAWGRVVQTKELELNEDVSVTLENRFCFVTIENPDGANVYVNDIALGAETKIERVLPAGQHRVSFSKSGRKIASDRFSAPPGKTLRLSASLADQKAPLSSLQEVTIWALAATAFASLAAGSVTAGFARKERDAFDQDAEQFRLTQNPIWKNRAIHHADKTDTLNISADILFGLTLGAVVAGFLTYFLLPRKQTKSKITVKQVFSAHEQGVWAGVRF